MLFHICSNSRSKSSLVLLARYIPALNVNSNLISCSRIYIYIYSYSICQLQFDAMSNLMLVKNNIIGWLWLYRLNISNRNWFDPTCCIQKWALAHFSSYIALLTLIFFVGALKEELMFLILETTFFFFFMYLHLLDSLNMCIQ